MFLSFSNVQTNEKFLLNLNGGKNLSDMDYILFRLNLEKRLSNPKVKGIKAFQILFSLNWSISVADRRMLAIEQVQSFFF